MPVNKKELNTQVQNKRLLIKYQSLQLLPARMFTLGF